MKGIATTELLAEGNAQRSTDRGSKVLRRGRCESDRGMREMAGEFLEPLGCAPRKGQLSALQP